MAYDLEGKWEYECPLRNAPTHRRIGSQIYHPASDDQHRDIHIFEVLHHAIHSDKEACYFEFFRRGGPFDINAYEMAK